jgi:nucleoside-diphosphate-sugar epimerase
MLAARGPGRKHDEDAFLANVAMASNLCHAVRARGCTHLVYISSDSVYPFDSVSIAEQTRPSVISFYSLMHLAREFLFGQIDGVPTAILRVAQVYGHGDPHNAYGPNRMTRSAVREGRIVLFGSGEETRDHIYVADVARLIVSVLKFRSHGLINVATGRSVSFLALAQMVRSACGGAVRIEHEPRKMPVLHRQFDTTLLRAAFPANELTSLERGVAMMLEDVRREKGGKHSRPDDELEAGSDVLTALSPTEALSESK